MTTNQTDPSATQTGLWRLAISDAIDREMDEVVTAAYKIIQEANLPSSEKFGRKQINNLQAVALEASSMAVVKDFVRYQMGRDTRREHWRQEQGRLGERVLQKIDELHQRAIQLVNTVKGQKYTPPSNETAEINRIWSILVRRFVAYLEHSQVYVQATKEATNVKR